MTGQIASIAWIVIAWLFLWYAVLRPTMRHRRAVRVWRDFHVRYLIRTKVHPGSRELDTL